MKAKAVSFLLGVFLQKKITPFAFHGIYISVIVILSVVLTSHYIDITIH